MDDWTGKMHDIYEILPVENNARSPPGLLSMEVNDRYCDNKGWKNKFRRVSHYGATLAILTQLEEEGYAVCTEAPNHRKDAIEGETRHYWSKKMKGGRNRRPDRNIEAGLDTLPGLVPVTRKVA